MVDLEKLGPLTEYYPSLTLLSFSLATALFIFILTTRVMNFNAAKRLNYKLYLWTMLLDMINHFPLQFNLEDNLAGCRAFMILNNWFSLLSISINVSLAYNIHMVFILNKPKKTMTELRTMAIAISGATILALPFTISLLLDKTCTIMIFYHGWQGLLKMMGLIGFSVFILTTYCLIVFLMVARKLLFHKHVDSHNSKLTNKYIRKLILRLCLYPIVPVIAWYPYIIVAVVDTLNLSKYDYIMIAIQGYLTCMIGTLNVFFFLFDPAVPEIYEEVKSRYSNSKRDSTVNLTEFGYKDTEAAGKDDKRHELGVTYDLQKSDDTSNFNIKLV
ncbi:hypothetical protein CONCODRAFT_9307 [Conidiobolus coronatus NRRL 28638]|uniref:G-protein coupled receptors family 1 profile domain-containing protein n=1 Tax=Conidiobolus coronatus (strain ATCC 28846 / CBS 209.66 / NRRL 28638) TaxID=796925 RepID=A0A137P048_CONC2|nr:hypothetical protein CONCODRAFT_9307 [Conidiobolus coronatus NRRL 28638]|eukprot:KXN68460.1 hypothetical protein CONCODRAFT_9307 [Conidiobolus coronatus NRRL 28638]